LYLLAGVLLVLALNSTFGFAIFVVGVTGRWPLSLAALKVLVAMATAASGRSSLLVVVATAQPCGDDDAAALLSPPPPGRRAVVADDAATAAVVLLLRRRRRWSKITALMAALQRHAAACFICRALSCVCDFQLLAEQEQEEWRIASC
jgi:hypothetical protein